MKPVTEFIDVVALEQDHTRTVRDIIQLEQNLRAMREHKDMIERILTAIEPSWVMRSPRYDG